MVERSESRCLNSAIPCHYWAIRNSQSIIFSLNPMIATYAWYVLFVALHSGKLTHEKGSYNLTIRYKTCLYIGLPTFILLPIILIYLCFSPSRNSVNQNVLITSRNKINFHNSSHSVRIYYN